MSRLAGDYRLADQLAATSGRVTMSGVHALLRAPLDTVRADAARGVRTSGVVCGYRGSPLGTVDTTFAAHRDTFAAHDVRFVNGVNEDLAATLIWGTQQVQREPTSTVDGVVGLWYGKAPGLDRSGDALRHANLSGVPPTGGVVAAVGDDPECKSSTVPAATEWTLADLAMPALAPATVQEVLDLGRHGYQISRRSGSWVGLKMHTDIADGYATVDVGGRLPPVEPFHVDGRPWSALLDDRMFAPWSLQLEQEAVTTRLDAVHHYVRAAGIDVVHGGVGARLGIIAAGKTYGDVVSALQQLGASLDDLGRVGVRVYKPALVWPLEPAGLRAFAAGLTEILVVEEKRAFLEEQVRSLLYGRAEAPAVHGRRGPGGERLVPAGGVLDVDSVAAALRGRIEAHIGTGVLRPPRTRLAVVADGDLPARTPYFCSGCPHNRSTVVPEGSVAGGGIGCHGMALFTRSRAVGTTQMGGEGVQWSGASMFSTERHRFQNIGDGTLAHSGFLAVRQAVAAGTNVTFKILLNGVVAMTGGQDAAGGLAAPELSRQLEAEGVRRIDVVTDHPDQYGRRARFAPGVRVHHRDRLDAVQRELREVPGVTALIYDQACAADLRRERKRGKVATPTTRVMINEAVCEGCGDCGDVSNCLSVHPVDTPFGRKTRIHQDSCNVDMSCLDGDCPAFVTVTLPSVTPRPPRFGDAPGYAAGDGAVPEPVRPTSAALLIAGIGGTGVVTVGQVLSTAANLDGLEVASVDQTGMAQKGGPVVSHLRIGAGATSGAARLETGRADAYLVFDLLTGVNPANLARLDPERTVAVVSTAQVPTGAMVADVALGRFPDLDGLRARLDATTRAAGNVYLDAEAIALERFGSQPAANLLVVGLAYQRGLLPQSAAAIERAIELNGVAVATNIDAFRLGRQLADDPGASPTGDGAAERRRPSATTRRLLDRVDADAVLSEVLAIRVPELIAYQHAAYARRYVDVVARVRRAELASADHNSDLSAVVARQLFHLMAYKDEYEVARLHRRAELRAAVDDQFGGGAAVAFHLQPPIASRIGLRRKVRIGERPGRAMFRALTATKRLRGTAFDPFGRTAERRDERRLIDEYVALVDQLLPLVDSPRRADAVRVAGLVDMVRGFAAVKRRNLDRYRAELPDALASLGLPAATSPSSGGTA